MIMGLPVRCRFWSVLQVVAIVVFHQKRVSSEVTEACVGSQLILTCEEMKFIQITNVVLGDSNCYGVIMSCCPKASSCTHNASANHRTEVHRTCDNKQSCTVRVLKEKIPCGFSGSLFPSNNDFERIKYNCMNETQNDTVNSIAPNRSTEAGHNLDHKSAEACVGTPLNLTCDEMKVINITAVIVGNAGTIGSVCYITYNNCTRYANDIHTMGVHRRCNGRSNCTVVVFNETILCEFNSSSDNDFERIMYDCVYDQQNDLQSTDETLTIPDNNGEARNEDEPNSHNLQSTDETLTIPDNNGEARNEDEPNSQALPVIVVITCLVILLAIVILFVIYRRKQRAQVKSFNPVAMTEVGNQQNESNIYADESKTTSLHENNAPLSVPLVDEDPPVYSEMVWKDDLSNRAAADESKAAIQAHMTGPDVYAEVNKPSEAQATASALETDRVGGTDLVKTGNCLPDQIYSLASNDVANIYANEPAADSKTSSLQDDHGQTLIENDLYSH